MPRERSDHNETAGGAPAVAVGGAASPSATAGAAGAATHVVAAHEVAGGAEGAEAKTNLKAAAGTALGTALPA